MHDLATLVVIVIMILKDTTTFKVLFIVSLFCAWNISLLWRSTVAFTYLKVKSAKCLFYFRWSWSWSCYFGLDLGLDIKDHRQRIPRFVIRRYLEKSIQKKLFAIYNHYKYRLFSKKKTIINSIFRKFTVAVYLWS